MVLRAFSEETVESLKSEEDRAAYLDACLKEDDPILIVHALGVIARLREWRSLPARQAYHVPACIGRYRPREIRNLPPS
jgi:DNA-binding phage protein